MIFRRKPKNRRRGRDPVLDVKLNSSQVRAARHRATAVGLTTLFLMLLCGYGLWCGGRWLLKYLVYENRAFAIEQFDVVTDGVIAPDQLRHWSGVKRGENLLALDLARVKRDLELIPVIASVSVERIPPRRLLLRVFEREPVAQLYVPRPGPQGIELAVCQVDTNGYVMLPLDPRQRSPAAPPAPEALPVLDGIAPEDAQPGRRLQSPQVTAALRLIGALDFSPMAGLVDFTRMDVSAQDVLVVRTDQGSEITFGLTDLDRQLRRWREIADRGQKDDRVIATLDLAVTNNLPVRWVEGGAAAVPSAPRPVRPPRTRSNHV
jgi:cell division septal protein FtsQ